MESMESKKFIQIVKELSAILIVGVVAIVFLNYTTDIFKTPRIIENKVPSDYPDYESLQHLVSLPIENNFESWTPNSKTEDAKSIKKIVIEKGALSKGYLYIEASIDGKPLTQWESIYIKMNNLGGHLFRPQSLPVPTIDKTELLFALNDIPYIELPYSEQKSANEIYRTNWFNLFKDNQIIEINAFISSLRPAKIDKMILYYQCIDDDLCELKLQ